MIRALWTIVKVGAILWVAFILAMAYVLTHP